MLEVRELTVAFGDFHAVDGVDLTVDDGEVLCLLGPSGCGKSTLLRAIAGLEPARTGTIRLDDEPLNGLRPDQRRVGLMFQDHALFPHRTVAENVGFGPRMRGQPPPEIHRRVEEALALVDLRAHRDRPVTQLSGGEQQRVALARAVADQPRLLMLDEPLGSLDRALRDRLLHDLPQLLSHLGTTTIYVTHDQDEALALADRVAVMRAGQIVQIDEPARLWRNPATPFVARFLGLEHLFPATVTNNRASFVFGELEVPETARTVIEAGEVTIALLLDALRITDALSPGHVDELEFSGEVRGHRFAGDHVRLRVATHRGPDVTVPVWRGDPPKVGETLTLALDPAAVRFLPPEPPSAADHPPRT